MDFSAGIEVDKSCVDAWKRRGHVCKITKKEKEETEEEIEEVNKTIGSSGTRK